MCCHRPTDHVRQQGVALIIALFVAALAAALLVGLQRDFDLSWERRADEQYLDDVEKSAYSQMK